MLPFYATSLSPEEEEQVASSQAEPPSEALAQVRLSPSLCSQDQEHIRMPVLRSCVILCTLAETNGQLQAVLEKPVHS